MQRVLVTGASGFIGSALCRAVLDQDMHVVAAYRPNSTHRFPESYSEAIEVGDIHGATGWRKALDGINTVMHLAGRAHHLNERPHKALVQHREINTSGTLRLARQAIEAGVKRFVFVSSIGVNGTSTKLGQAFREDDAPQPRSAYALSKLEAELGLKAIAQESGLELVIVRPPLVYGLGAPGNFHRLVSWVARGVPLPFASIKNQRSFIGIDNLTSALLACAVHPQAAHETFLVSDGKDMSTPELVGLLAAAMDVKVRLFPVPPFLIEAGARCLGRSAVATALCKSLCIDSSKVRHLLQWQPPISVPEGLRRSVNPGLC